MLGWELNANHYRTVHLAARYDDELEWFRHGVANPALGIAQRLQIHSSTAREWIRVGHALRDLCLVDAAFSANELSYAKVRILTRWADPDNEAQFLALAHERSAARLTTAIAQALDQADDDGDERDSLLYQCRRLSSYTDGDGMTIIRVALPPAAAKPILAAVDELVRRIAQTPAATDPAVGKQNGVASDPPADASDRRSVASDLTEGGGNAPADGSPLTRSLRELQQRWQPNATETPAFPSLAQQRADAFGVLFLDLNIKLTTEVVLHVRGDGNTLDDGTPLTNNAITRRLDGAFIRLLIHDAERHPVNVSSRRRHPSTKQKRFVMETHDHECVDCESTDLLELDHNPPYHQTKHTITDELEPRCAPCHRAHHRHDGHVSAHEGKPVAIDSASAPPV